jgi:hypothetical protein
VIIVNDRVNAALALFFMIVVVVVIVACAPRLGRRGDAAQGFSRARSAVRTRLIDAVG